MSRQESTERCYQFLYQSLSSSSFFSWFQSVVHLLPLSLIAMVAAMSGAVLSLSPVHLALFSQQQLLSHVCVKVDVSSSRSVQKGRPPSLPPSLPLFTHSQFYFLTRQWHSLSLSLSLLLLARSLIPGHNRRSVLRAAANGGSAELQRGVCSVYLLSA